MILLLDNYDSFVYNLLRYARELGRACEIVRSDAITVDAIRAYAPSHIIISPGPCTPDEAGVSMDVVRQLGEATPILGVCLGHQVIGQAFGGCVVRAKQPLHGRSSAIVHNGRGLFDDLPSPLTVGRYHSLVVERDSLPPCLEVTALCDQGEIMAMQHQSWPVHGVQFHPESILTQAGMDLIQRFLTL